MGIHDMGEDLDHDSDRMGTYEVETEDENEELETLFEESGLAFFGENSGFKIVVGWQQFGELKEVDVKTFEKELEEECDAISQSGQMVPAEQLEKVSESNLETSLTDTRKRNIAQLNNQFKKQRHGRKHGHCFHRDKDREKGVQQPHREHQKHHRGHKLGHKQHGKQGTHRGHKHIRPYPRPHHDHGDHSGRGGGRKYLVTRELNLICEGRVIDKIRCIRVSPHSNVPSPTCPLRPNSAQNPFISPQISDSNENDHHQLHSLHHRKTLRQDYIFMHGPCSNGTLTLYASNSFPLTGLDVVDTSPIEESAHPLVGDISDECDIEGTEDEASEELELHAKPGCRQHHRHGHYDHDHNGKRRPFRRPRHPYKNLCVATGHFCGSRLFGCRFSSTTMYDCKAIGAKPIVHLKNAKACGGSKEDNGSNPDPCKCTQYVSSTAPICGSRLSSYCKNIEPNAMYYCPQGLGSKFEVLRICQPGTQCRESTDVHGHPRSVCGASTCDCTGDNKLCADQFPVFCPKISSNTIYQCTLNNRGLPEKIQECTSGQSCVSVSDGTVCASNDCLCHTDGTICGEVFPQHCRIPATGLYKCVVGQKPVLQQNCFPDRCSASTAEVRSAMSTFDTAALEFGSLASHECVNSCLCTSHGIVSGSTFPVHCKLDKTRLYVCSSAGSTPIRGKKCTNPKGCFVNPGDDSISDHDHNIGSGNDTVCSCKHLGPGPIAGSDIPPQCHADPTVIYFCPKDDCDNPSKYPLVLQQCPPGSTVQNGSRPRDPHCGYTNCKYTSAACNSNLAICSDQFPASCNLKPNSVYKCSSTGVPVLVSACSSSETCVSGPFEHATCAAASASKDGCKCAKDGTVCGSSFPLACGFSSTKTFSCKKGRAPIVKSTCRSGTTCLPIGSGAQCTNACSCAVPGDVCGSTFPSSCGFDASTIYKCSSARSIPMAGKKCSKGCVVQAGADICYRDDVGENKCSCGLIGVGNFCGSDLPVQCMSEKNQIYTCRNTTQGAPEVLSICYPGTLCEKRPHPIGTACGATTCNCNLSGEICSSDIRETCDLEANAIYKCSSTGKPEIVKKCDSDSTCVTYNNLATCVSNDCSCTVDGEVCGSSFPLSCGYKGTTLFTCTKGSAPIAKHDCAPNRCSAEASQTKNHCIDSCSCDKNDFVCGSTFPSSCSLDESTLYRCTGAGFKPIPVSKCTDGHCSVNAGPDACDGSSTPIVLPLEDTCTCPATSPVCGKVLQKTVCKEVMDIDPSFIYHCPSGPGSLPEIQDICQPGSICITQPEPIGASCGGSSCNCTGVQEICSGAFKEYCGVLPNSIYQCTSAGKPILVQECASNEVCVTESNGSQCVLAECICERDGIECGEKFHLSCGLKRMAAYECTKGEPPVFIMDFAPERCAAFKAIRTPVDGVSLLSVFSEAPTSNDRENRGDNSVTSVLKTLDVPPSDSDGLVMSSCHCTTEISLVCGLSFPLRCGYDSTVLYNCGGPDQIPVKVKECSGIDSCVVNPGNDACGVCTCGGPGTTCGRKFPESCGFDVDQLYSCDDIGSAPIPLEKCTTNGCMEEISGNSRCDMSDPCKCIDQNDSCGSEFPPECHMDPGYLYTCGRRGDLPIMKEQCAFGCLQGYLGEPDRCRLKEDDIEDCSCRDETDVCGSEFPDICGLDDGTLYKCVFGKGSLPEQGLRCESGQCIVKQAENDVCSNTGSPTTCKCNNKKVVCGAAYPAVCGFEEDRLYACSETGADPVPGNICPNGCESNADSATMDECITSECTCPKAGILCGQTMELGCGFSDHSIYDCTKGVGSIPVLQELCVPGTACSENTEGASCGGSKCTCTGDISVCSNQFPDDCGYQKNAVYKCTLNGGQPVLEIACETNQSCKSFIDDAVCASSDCNCSEDGLVCGAKFSPSCELSDTSLYSCETGKRPILSEDCTPGYCGVDTSVIDSPSYMCFDPCKCPSVDLVCGSTFEPECNLEAGSLYRCNTVGGTPDLQEVCPGSQCIVNVGLDECGPSIDPSQCLCNSTVSICGSSLDPECNTILGSPIDPNSIYTCSGNGQVPVKSTTCTGDESCSEKASGAECENQCTCTGTEKACSKAFPAACNLPEGIYTCGSDGTPKKVKDCVGASVCVDGAPEPTCVWPECICKNSNARCGSSFSEICGYEGNDLYSCVEDQLPVLIQGCGSGTCSAAVLPSDPTHSTEDFCIEQCECKEAGTTVCASTYDPICGFDSKALMTCDKVGDIPTIQENCTLSCEAIDGSPDICKQDPCACSIVGDVCGSSFPNECAFDAQAVYSCKTNSSLPEKMTDCATEQVCLDLPAGPICVSESCICMDDSSHCGSTFVETCNLKKDTLYQCSKGVPPEISHDCAPGICSANIASDTPVTRQGIDDTCIEQCACKDVGKVCASTFDSACSYNVNDLMMCGNVGDKPTISETCTVSCTVQTGDDICADDP
ncbi:hypothetical protein FBU30_003684, partial [Linnemannia zychae]